MSVSRKSRPQGIGLLISSLLLFCLFVLPRAAFAEDASRLKTAVFAGGCFWCMEPAFEKVAGVKKVLSGYSGGSAEDADYDKVSYGKTDHLEVVEVSYDPKHVSYADLLKVFWKNIDPTTPNRQFCDAGKQYSSAIFYGSDEERTLAEATKAEIEKTYGYKVVTQIRTFEAFYPAEEYHQDFYKKNPLRYQSYRVGCRRDARLKELWGEKK